MAKDDESDRAYRVPIKNRYPLSFMRLKLDIYKLTGLSCFMYWATPFVSWMLYVQTSASRSLGQVWKCIF